MALWLWWAPVALVALPVEKLDVGKQSFRPDKLFHSANEKVDSSDPLVI